MEQGWVMYFLKEQTNPPFSEEKLMKRFTGMYQFVPKDVQV